MRLIDVYSDKRSEDILWRLLKERTPEQSISHKKMPKIWEHADFFRSRPYRGWFLVEVDEYVRGAVYLSKQREIGVFIFQDQRGHGYGRQAVQLLMQMYPGAFLANVNPVNQASQRLFESLGFRHIQNTLSLETT